MIKIYLRSGLVILFSVARISLAGCNGTPDDFHAPACFTLQTEHRCDSVPGCQWFDETPPEPKSPVVRICNKTDMKISIAMKFVRTNYKVIGEEGWWNLEAGQCNDFEAVNATSLSYFAKSYQGHQYWFGNGEPMCYDASGNRFERVRQLSDNSCGNYTEIQSYQTIPLKLNDFIQAKIEGPGQDLSPDPGFSARALAVCKATGEYSIRKAPTLEAAQTLALNSCQSDGNQCEVVMWIGTDNFACMAVLSGPGVFRAWSWSGVSKEAAINQSLKYCQVNGQACNVDFAMCNNE